MTVEELAQDLVGKMRAVGQGRLVAHFTVDHGSVALGDVAAYSTIGHEDGVGPGGEPLAGIYLEEAYPNAAVTAAAIALLRERYATVLATGVLKVDEDDRVWADPLVVTEDVKPGLRVEL